ncbi:FlgD immunoglobulin-like domain containing protein [Streptomyces sp. NPDC056785]|uniref:FlgD immunoglobulin-like domain containing protein n=1 Tax=Streptomyces sp. NPDC056785 TaxID=3345944 RepID=UPI003685838B
MALGGAVALTCAVQTVPAQAAPAADTPVATVQLNRATPPEVLFGWAGASGFRYTLPDTGSPTALRADYPDHTPPAHAGPDDLATGTDVVTTAGVGTVTQKHQSTGVTVTLTVPPGQTYKAAVGWSVVTQDADGALHVLRAAGDGTTTDLPVTGLPAGATPDGVFRTGGSVRRLAVGYTLDGADTLGLLDLADGTFRSYITGALTTAPIRFDDRWLVAANKVARVDAAPGTDPVPVPTYGDYKIQGVVGDQLMLANPSVVFSPDTYRLVGISLADGTRTTVIDRSSGSYTPTLDGGLLATAGPSSADWHVYRVTPTETGATAAPVLDVRANRATVGGMMLSGGELLMYGNTTGQGGYDAVHGVQLDAAGRPAGPQTYRASMLNLSPCLAGDVACPQFEALGDGGFAYLSTGADGKESVHVTGRDPNSFATEATGASGGRIGTGTGRYVLYNGGTPGVQKVADFPRGADGETALDRTRTAAAVWGQRLWTPGSSQGSVVALDLKSGKNVATVATGAPCTPSEIQAVDAWLYWTCGASGPAGVYDRATGRAISVPAGQARLADGYLLRENRTTHELLLTDFHAGSATTRTVAVLPTADRDTGGNTGRWTADRFGGNVAYQTDRGEVAIVTAGVPTSPLAQMEAQTDAAPGPTVAEPWRPVWQLSKPSAWTLQLTSTTGTVVRTLTGSSTAAAVRASWDGATTAGGRAPRGSYTWKLTAVPRDHQGPDLQLTGTTTVD